MADDEPRRARDHRPVCRQHRPRRSRPRARPCPAAASGRRIRRAGCRASTACHRASSSAASCRRPPGSRAGSAPRAAPRRVRRRRGRRPRSAPGRAATPGGSRPDRRRPCCRPRGSTGWRSGRPGNVGLSWQRSTAVLTRYTLCPSTLRSSERSCACQVRQPVAYSSDLALERRLQAGAHAKRRLGRAAAEPQGEAELRLGCMRSRRSVRRCRRRRGRTPRSAGRSRCSICQPSEAPTKPTEQARNGREQPSARRVPSPSANSRRWPL